MGNTSQCIHSAETSQSKKCDSLLASTNKKKPIFEIFSDKDKNLIRTSWNKVKKSHDLKQIGIDMMVIIFTKNPEIKFIWKFAANLETEEEYRNSSQLKSHGYKVMEAVNAYVNSLENIESSDKLLFELGNRHSTYANGYIKKDYFTIVSGAILETIKVSLDSDYTPEIANAWHNAINHLKIHIASGLVEHQI